MFNPYQFNGNSMPSATQPYGYPMSPYMGISPQTQPAQQAQMNTNKIFVSGIEEVKMKMLPPNSEFVYLDNEKSILYQKTVDSTGHFEVKAYDITEHKEQNPAENAQNIDPQYFVSRKDFDGLKAEFTAFRDKMKGNYGRGTQETNRTSEERK